MCWNGRLHRRERGCASLESGAVTNATGLIGNQRGDAATLGAAELEPNVSLLINSPLCVAGRRVLFCFDLFFLFLSVYQQCS